MIRTHEIKIGDNLIKFRLRHSNRRTLAVTVHPDLEVTVTVPQKAGIANVLEKVRKRAVWIQRQQRYFSQFLPKLPPCQYVRGETHRYLGRQYRLKVVKADTTCVKLGGSFIWVCTNRPENRTRTRELVEDWYLQRAKDRLARSFAETAARMGTRLPKMPRMRIRRMTKRWGSWTRRGGVWLNPELVKAPVSCIDYVVTHELCHAVYGNHGKNFYDLLRRIMPDWEMRKARLERAAAESGLDASAWQSVKTRNAR